MPSRTPTAFFAITLGSIGLIGPLAVHLFLPVIPSVKISFEISDALAQLTFSITLVTMAFMTLVYGGLSDRYGRRPVLLVGLVLFLIGSAISAVADTVLVLVAGRLIQAVGAGCGVTLSRTIARDAYGPERLVQAIAYLTMFYTLGPMISPVVGGFLADAFGWRSVFWFALLAGALITIAAFLVLFETRPALEAGAARQPVLQSYAQLFTHLRFVALVFQSGFQSGTFFAMAAASTFLMQEYLGRPSSEFGVYFLAFPAGYFLGNLASGRLSRRVSVETMVLAGSILTAVTVASQSALVLGGHLRPLVLFIPGFLISVAQGLSLPNAQAGAIRVMPNLAGTAAGIGVFVQTLCGALFSQLYGLLADGTARPMVFAVSLGAALALATGIMSFVLGRRANRRSTVTDRLPAGSQRKT